MMEIRLMNKAYNSGLKMQSLLGKTVRDPNGTDVGVVTEIRLDPNTLHLDGIEMDRGFFGTYTFIGRKYISRLSDEGAVLNINLATDYKGMKVFDSNGKEVGTVKEVKTEGTTNDISSIVVETGVLNDNVVFNKSDIRGVGEGIMLNVVV